MKIRRKRFNIYLFLTTALMLGLGCHTTESKSEKDKKKELSTIRLHVESNLDPSKRSGPVQIHGFTLNVETAPFMTEIDVKEAKILDVVGGFQISIQFNREGSWLLEQYTAAGRGKHLALFSQWTTPPQKALNEGRWLASPFIHTHITDGVVVFTPDATREEAERIVLGLNNVAKKIREQSLPD